MYYANTCCLNALGVGDPAKCEDARVSMEAFQRLAQKTGGKYEKQRPEALKNAGYWKNQYETCMGTDEATVAAKQVEAQQQIAEAVRGVPLSPAEQKRSNLWLYLGVGGAVVLVLGALWLSRGRK